MHSVYFIVHIFAKVDRVVRVVRDVFEHSGSRSYVLQPSSWMIIFRDDFANLCTANSF